MLYIFICLRFLFVYYVEKSFYAQCVALTMLEDGRRLVVLHCSCAAIMILDCEAVQRGPKPLMDNRLFFSRGSSCSEEILISLLVCVVQRFFLCGRLIFGPDVRSLVVTVFLIVVPVAVFCALVAWRWYHHDHKSGALPILIAACVFTAIVSCFPSLECMWILVATVLKLGLASASLRCYP